jgi:acetate kinase
MVELKTNLPATGRLTEYGAMAMNPVNFLDSMERGFGGLTAPPMATRSGDVPQDLILYLLRSKVFDDASLEKMLYEAAGLLGLSGISGNTRVYCRRGRIAAVSVPCSR